MSRIKRSEVDSFVNDLKRLFDFYELDLYGSEKVFVMKQGFLVGTLDEDLDLELTDQSPSMGGATIIDDVIEDDNLDTSNSPVVNNILVVTNRGKKDEQTFILESSGTAEVYVGPANEQTFKHKDLVMQPGDSISILAHTKV